MTAIVVINGTEREPFTISTRVKPGSVIAPTLFTIYPCAVLFLVRDRLPRRVETGWENFQPGLSQGQVTKTAAIDQYDDDCAILAHVPEELQTSLDLLTGAYQSI